MKAYNKIKFLVFFLLTSLLSLGIESTHAQNSEGTLMVDLKPFVSDIKLKKKVLKQLESGALEWGVSGNQFVTTLTNKRFINFDIPYMTRYGTSKEIKLKPGKYTITCVGFKYKGGLSIQKVLKKAAFFNIDELTFEVIEGKTTTLEILPKIEKNSSLVMKVFSPDLFVTVTEDNEVKAEQKLISIRHENSINWEDYNGPLKFEKEVE
ncbi:hypothetical protein [Tenacibaculum caenipelagi]|uniref:Uncharacterized protein n=1 Tax=Tenacibaculum caenipelagi TaxID=1325435 RepID=A0A4R6TME0_9FLAO|nr:hypothetical protein [Tenacibaculum caenipelagi]TDQ30230.1 hypothetical protein DFQ07_0570 [Tenacibaculum caenipelagi]